MVQYRLIPLKNTSCLKLGIDDSEYGKQNKNIKKKKRMQRLKLTFTRTRTVIYVVLLFRLIKINKYSFEWNLSTISKGKKLLSYHLKCYSFFLHKGICLENGKELCGNWKVDSNRIKHRSCFLQTLFFSYLCVRK